MGEGGGEAEAAAAAAAAGFGNNAAAANNDEFLKPTCKRYSDICQVRNGRTLPKTGKLYRSKLI